jgi:hypothetical protein
MYNTHALCLLRSSRIVPKRRVGVDLNTSIPQFLNISPMLPLEFNRNVGKDSVRLIMLRKGLEYKSQTAPRIARLLLRCWDEDMQKCFLILVQEKYFPNGVDLGLARRTKFTSAAGGYSILRF